MLLTRSYCSLFLLLLSLIGCATQTIPPIAEDTENWRARGKFSFQSPEEKQSGNFDWQQTGEEYRVRMFGPLGLGAVTLSGNAESVTLEQKGKVYQSNQPDQMIARATGIEMPVSALGDWLIGQPMHSTDTEIHLDENGKLKIARSQGWRLSYVNNDQPPHLPKRIHAERQGTRLTLVITRWSTDF